MKLALLGLAVAAGVGLASGRAHASSGEEPAAAAATGGIEVKVEDSFTDVETTRRWVEERAARALEELEPKLAAEDLVRIVVKGGAFEYRISLVLLRRGKPLTAEQQPSEIACACSSDEMLETVATAIEAGAHALGKEAEREREAELAAKRLRRAEEQRQQEMQQATMKKRRIGRLGVGGAITSATGVGAIAGGIIMMVMPPQVIGEPDTAWATRHTRNYRPPGFAVTSVGVLLLSAGITMMALDPSRCPRRRDAQGCRSVKREESSIEPYRRHRIAVVLTPQEAGLSLRGRF